MKVELLDTTLREGEQCCGIFFPVATKVRLAQLLDVVGVDFIEAGHPATAPSIRQAASEIARLDLRARKMGHARLVRDEIRLVRDLGLTWVGLFSGVNGASRERYRLSARAVLARISGAVRYAKDLGLSVRFTCEDASRTDPAQLVELYGLLQELGADRMSYADTVGIDTPGRLDSLRGKIGASVPFSSLHFHFHDDRSMALANAKRAAELGAQCIDASLLGIGERMGIVRLEDMIVTDEARTEAIRSARQLVAGSIELRRFHQRRFAHKSGIHIHGVLRDPSQYEHADPECSGSGRIIVLSKLIGRSGLRMLLSRQGFDADAGDLERLLARVKADESLELTDPREIARYFEGCCMVRRSGAPAVPVS